jgi:hypothetical protein
MRRDELDSGGFDPLCLTTEDLGYHDSKIYQADLERRAPELFVADEALCNTEIREYVKPASNFPQNQAEREGQDRSCESGNFCEGGASLGPHTISTIDSLRTKLQVGNPRGSHIFFYFICQKF